MESMTYYKDNMIEFFEIADDCDNIKVINTCVDGINKAWYDAEYDDYITDEEFTELQEYADELIGKLLKQRRFIIQNREFQKMRDWE